MTDEQCMAIVDAINELTSAVNTVAENLDNLHTYCDSDLRKEIKVISGIMADMYDYKL